MGGVITQFHYDEEDPCQFLFHEEDNSYIIFVFSNQLLFDDNELVPGEKIASYVGDYPNIIE